MSIKILVLGGAGHIGSVIVSELHRLDSTAEITIADKNVEKAKEIAKMVGGEIKILHVDATAEDSLVNAIKGFDVAVSAIGPFHKFGVPVLKAALRAGVNFVDINDDYDATEEALKLHEEARERKVTALIGMGATPGITNLLARHGTRKLDEVSEIGTYWIWTAIDPTMGPAIIDHYFHAITGMIPTYRNGEWVMVKALSEPEYYEFPKPIGSWEVAHAGHPEPVTIPRYIKVKNVCNKGGVWPSDLNDIAKVFSTLGLTSLKEIRLGDHIFKARDIAVAITLALSEITPPEETEKSVGPLYERLGEYALTGLGLATIVKGVKEGKEHIIKYGIAYQDATKATALPAALATLELAKTENVRAGVYSPEADIISVEKLINNIKKEIKIELVETEIETL
ncbi:saccharopine dehydrogenase NADP-binding domain-containing protein [Candidatus Bathyarchaeota archaeon]|nr:saccharopine dehydrogenase NADP-binding domain-containing protein [Candidatus Bathyarchaeota archaeon]